MRLGDLGERRILKEIIPKFVRGAGDDCANLGKLTGHVVVTTDPVPVPAASVIAGDPDLYWLGWLLVTINASDIAAAGARPISFVAALDLPTDLEVDELERLLSGIRDSCDANSLSYVGGNLREAHRISAVGTAIGVSVRKPLSRSGAEVGDKVIVIGRGGKFWADAERVRAGGFVNKKTSPLFSPVSQSPFVYQLHDNMLLKCAMDTSDGLAPSLVELSLVNGLGIDVDLQRLRLASDSADVAVDPEKLWMGWGDWTVLAATSENCMPAIHKQMSLLGGTVTEIGEFVAGDEVMLKLDGREKPIGRLESERFAKDSWFSEGIDGYVRRLREFSIP
ncbi:thiamine-phosphate kinase [Rhizobium sp. PP-CC-2G-626]|nr:thiamine-phosphate kinase [Rhizobium sp. PP-CC-2G-626]